MQLPNFSLEGKVALITGGGRGIGRGIALTFASAGASVVISSRTASELEAVAAEITATGKKAIPVTANIAIKAEVDAMVEKARGEFGRIDILVNNAAMNILSPIIDLREDGWDRIIDTDLKGYFLCSQAVGRVMIQQKGGNIINISSTGAYRAAPGLGAYGIAKAGVEMLTKVLAVELAEHNIRSNCIALSMVKTKFSQPLWSNTERLQSRLGKMPIKRLAEVEDVVGAALFLASNASSYITGKTIIIDGGMLA